MPSSNHSPYHLTKPSIVFAMLLCLNCLGLSTLPVHAQAPANGRRNWVNGNSVNHPSPRVPTQSAERVSAAELPTASQQSQTTERSDLHIETQKKDLVGSWLFTVTAPDGTSFKALNTFTADGNLIGAAQGDISTANQLFSTAQHGAWTHLGGRNFAFTFLAISYGPEGELAGTLRVRSNLTLSESGDELSGQSVFEFSDPNGNVLDSGNAPFQGKRITLEPLN